MKENSFVCKMRIASDPPPPPLTIHNIENQGQNRAAGGGICDVHGVFTDVQAQRVLVEDRPVLQQILQGDDPTWNQQGWSDGPCVTGLLGAE